MIWCFSSSSSSNSNFSRTQWKCWTNQLLIRPHWWKTKNGPRVNFLNLNWRGVYNCELSIIRIFDPNFSSWTKLMRWIYEFLYVIHAVFSACDGQCEWKWYIDENYIIGAVARGVSRYCEKFDGFYANLISVSNMFEKTLLFYGLIPILWVEQRISNTFEARFYARHRTFPRVWNRTEPHVSIDRKQLDTWLVWEIGSRF